MNVILDGFTLKAQDVVAVARNNSKAVLGDEARKNIAEARAYIEKNWLHDEAPLMYAFNTGVGLFKDQRILIKDMVEYQNLVIKAHATGVGAPFDEDVVRATMVLRANAFASNFSGPAVEVVERLLTFLNLGLLPVIPQKGSVGASGDLAPLAYLAGAIASFPEAKINYQGAVMPAPEAIAKAGVPVDFTLGAKDASALINGSTVSLALGVLAAHDARRIAKAADIALCLSLEAMRGELIAFQPPIHNARPHKGQKKVARNVIRIAGDSKRCSEAARLTVYPEENRKVGVAPAPRVQDVYSLRCAPQVHGPVADALDYIDGILSVEMNSATDNPLMFEKEEGGYQIISGGNFHGQYVAQAMDLLSLSMADLGSISERRLARLIDPTLSYGLPRNLNAGTKGLNTGYGTVQCSMSALVMENRTLSFAASVDSIPGKSNAEDHVSNSTWCARKARTIVENVEQIVATEILMACQALSLIEPIAKDHPIGKGSRAALECVRKVIAPALTGDRWFHTEIEQALELVRSGAIIAAVEKAIGELE
jgi:histidine ammonia-lyase